jgi:dienelactone hydrolase
MAACLALFLGVATLASPAPEPPPRPGQLVEGRRCESDPSQTYTLYLPGGYTPSRRWPALLVLDPRGRSVLAASLFREAAEAAGWILLSSNDTRSDGPAEPNVKALQALWPEVHLRYATDPHRIYAAGFSGGGMLAWELGRTTAALAGVIASGARWEDRDLERRFPFPSFGTAGDVDFNNSPMRAVHARLREWGTPERLEIFEGPHSWMPAALAGEAIDWMELQAMKAGLRPADPGFVAERLAADLRRARALEAEGRPLQARRRFEAITSTFTGLADVGEARREAARLAGLRSTRAALKEEQRWDRYEQATLRRLEGAYRALLASDPPLSPPAFRAEVRLEELRRHAEAPSYEGVVGRRLLATLATQTGFYMTRDLLARGDLARARNALSVATEAVPEQPVYWYNLACVLARSGARAAAVDALERAVAGGFADRAHMAVDEDLASLRGEARFRALVGGPPP